MPIGFDKAFDTIEWNYMFQVLEKCISVFIRFEKCCYTNINNCINNNVLQQSSLNCVGEKDRDAPSCVFYLYCV